VRPSRGRCSPAKNGVHRRSATKDPDGKGSAWWSVTARRATPYADASETPNLMTYRTGRPAGLPGMDAEDALDMSHRHGVPMR